MWMRLVKLQSQMAIEIISRIMAEWRIHNGRIEMGWLSAHPIFIYHQQS